ncbi:MAG: (Fe-S)-binding protein [Kiritimatiellae bacterium]|nr:(Fe-S)-binding protein [Kiritimatiellia bacterium]
MNMDKYLDVINACRFCFMCRHLATLAAVTGKEADTTRGHALIADRIRMDKAELANTDYIRTIFQADLSGACRKHCVSSYDEIGLKLALRQDIVEAGLAPAAVSALAKEFTDVQFKVSGNGDMLYYPHPCIEAHQPEIAKAFLSVVPNVKVIDGGDCGKVLKLLGFAKESQAVAARFQAAVKASGCKTVVVSNPAAYDFLKSDGAMDGITVLPSSEVLLNSNLGSAAKLGKLTFINSDFLRNYQDCKAPMDLLAKLGCEVDRFGTNCEDSYACGEGSMPGIRLFPELTRKMVAHVADMAKRFKVETIVTPSPFVKHALTTYAPELKVLAIEEVAAAAKR